MEFIGYKSGHFPFKLTHSACMSLQSFLKESKMHAAATLIKTYMFPIYEKFVVFFRIYVTRLICLECDFSN